MKNPFNPSFGRVPKIYLDREQIVHQLEEDIQDVDSPYLTTLIYGMRGSGKTTLLTDVSLDIKKQPDWIVVDLTMGDALIPTLIELVYKQADSGLKSMLKKVDGIRDQDRLPPRAGQRNQLTTSASSGVIGRNAPTAETKAADHHRRDQLNPGIT